MEPALLRVSDLGIGVATDASVVPVVQEVGFRLDRGRTLCLVGESGCGKSVTARAILRLVDPPLWITPGSRVRFGNAELTNLPEAALRDVRGRDIAMIFQEPMSALNPVRRVGAQVVETLIRHRGLSRRDAMARAIELLREVGIASPERCVHQFPHELSGGMQQRVMIAAAVACEPKVLIADEPTTALDPTIQGQILDLLCEMQERLQMAILLITHDIGVVAEMAHEIAVMYAGSIVEAGPARDVLTAPQHPYTAALLRSIPRLGMPRDRPLEAIGGTVPAPSDWPPGCRFAPRCTHAFAPCTRERPPSFAAGSQAVACWLCADQPGVPREAPQRAQA
jgi:oligopeptide/dipeptide ABC transporter ATP-binding protein